MDDGSMNPEILIRDGGAYSHTRKDRLEQGGVLEGKVREKGGGGSAAKEKPSYRGPANFSDLNDTLELSLDPSVGSMMDPDAVKGANIERGRMILAARKDEVFGKKEDPDSPKGRVAAIMDQAVEKFDKNKASNYPNTSDPMLSVLREIRGIDAGNLEEAAPVDMTPYAGLVKAWLGGIPRVVEMRYFLGLQAKGVALNPGEELRMEELKNIQNVLGWGGQSVETIERIDRLVDRSIQWRGDNDPIMKARLDATGAGRRGVSGVETGRIVGELEGWPIVEETPGDTTTFSEKFLKEHGLPKFIYLRQLNHWEKRDMRTALFYLYQGQGAEGLDVSTITKAMQYEERETAEAGGRQPDLQGVARKASDAWTNFLYGTYPVMRLRTAESNRTLRSWVGPEGGGGILYEVRPNMKWITQELGKDSQARSAMRVWIALGGSPSEDYRNINGMTDEEREVVDKYYGLFKYLGQIKEYKNLEKLPPAVLNYLKSIIGEEKYNELPEVKVEVHGKEESVKSMSREMGKELMDVVQEDLVQAGIDEGVVGLTREVAGLIAWNPETVDPRKQYFEFEKYLKNDSKASRSLIGRTMYVGGPIFASFLKEEGIEGFLGRIERWTNASSWLMQAYDGMQKLIRNLKNFDDYVKGEDEFNNLSTRHQAVNKMVDEVVLHKEFPPIDDETAEDLRQWPVYKGRGSHAQAGRVGPFDLKGQVRAAFGGEMQAIEDFFDWFWRGGRKKKRN